MSLRPTPPTVQRALSRAVALFAVSALLILPALPVGAATPPDTPPGTPPAPIAVEAPAVAVTTVDAAGRPRITRIAVDTPTTATRLSRSWSKSGLAAVPDRTVSITATPRFRPARTSSNDPYRAYQWALDAAAFARTWSARSAAGEVVAVLDTGVEVLQEDLAAGQVLAGTDLVAPGNGRTDPHGHGTAVAAVIAASTGNGRGMAGAARSVRILPVRVLGTDGTGSLAVAAQGLIWAVDHGATVVNMSFAATGIGSFVPMDNAIAYARSKGVVVIAAAGNDGPGAPVTYPAANPQAIAVAALSSNPYPSVSSFSSRGSWVDVAAPGGDIIAPVVRGDHGEVLRNRYMAWSGTSMAAPYVAAEAALVRAAGPGLTPDQVRSVITSTAAPVPGAGPRDVGAGAVNVWAAVTAAGVPVDQGPYVRARIPDRAVAARPGGGYYTLAADGTVTAYDGAPDYGSPRFGWDIARDLAVMPDGAGYVVLDGWGGLHRYGSARTALAGLRTPYWRGWDIARSVVLSPSGSGVAILDGWGGVHARGDAPRSRGLPYWRGWSIARDLAITADGAGYVVLDGWGGLHSSAGVGRLRGGPYWRGWDVARSVVLNPGGAGFAVLDALGGVHARAGAAPVAGLAYAGEPVYRALTYVG